MRENLIPLSEDVSTRRIFSPFAYRLVRELNIVPIAHTEVARLAAWFPVAWRRQGDDTQLVAIRSLLPTFNAIPPAVRLSLEHLPLLLQAYPFGLDPEQGVRRDTPKMLCDVFADYPENVGAPITTPDRQLTKATLQRFGALDAFCEQAAETENLARLLADEDLLEPWALSFDVDGRRIEVPDILIVRQSLFGTGRLAKVVAEKGALAAEVLGFHRLSLFRAGPLLASARTALTSTRRDQGELSSAAEDWAE
ncbi:SapC family protein [Terrihabitans sp. B22-R8]|uniref:SapC family protein n=1 Tax=Terrihabitans sp. B22-R8 TaxID=3425128 RepID=UPI00403D474E